MNRSRLILVALVAIGCSFLPTTPLLSQEEELTPPPTWQLRLDDPDRGSVEDIWYVDMPPGWHITTGPAAILWDPADTTNGDFRIESESYLFDPEGRREGFGIFFGGSNLQGEAQSYTYFLIREGGEFIIKERRGSETPTIVPWTSNEAIVSFATKPADTHTAKNILAVVAQGDLLNFFVNGAEVASLPRDRVPTQGVVGFRVNHSVNLHISTLDITSRVP
jgi:hypothetical protein